MADTRVEGLAGERHARGLELRARLGHVCDPKRDVIRVGGEREPELLRLPDAERHLAAGDLEPARGDVTIERQVSEL